MTNVLEHNHRAWNQESRSGNSPWCEPVDSRTIAEARRGQCAVILTPSTTVPAAWFDGLSGKRVLCLASGGGQQAPVLAAAGAKVTSFDISEEQLAKDQLVAKREGLEIECVRGDMADLARFPARSFDVVFHPTSNLFVADVRKVWRECFRVLDTRGRLLAGFMNPDFFLFDHDALEKGEPLVVRYGLPYSDEKHLSENELQKKLDERRPLQFGHSLSDQIAGQIEAGFVIGGLYEDHWTDAATPLNPYMPTSIATLAIKR